MKDIYCPCMLKREAKMIKKCIRRISKVGLLFPKESELGKMTINEYEEQIRH